jgi:hypothetical protein
VEDRADLGLHSNLVGMGKEDSDQTFPLTPHGLGMRFHDPPCIIPELRIYLSSKQTADNFVKLRIKGMTRSGRKHGCRTAALQFTLVLSSSVTSTLKGEHGSLGKSLSV